MRNFLLFFLIAFSAQAQRYDTAVSYLQFVDGHNAQVVEQTWNYMYTYTQENDYNKQKGQLKKLENMLKRSLRYIEKEPAYDTSFQQAVIDYLKGNIAIVTNDYGALLKANRAQQPSTDKYELQKAIRNAMFQLRSDYDAAVKFYATTYDLKITPNSSALARQMEYTIMVYDYYNKLNMLAQQLKEAEENVWKDLTTQTPAQFNSRLKQLQIVIDKNSNLIKSINVPNDNADLQIAFVGLQQSFSDDFQDHLEPIVEILKAYSSNDRTDVLTKTDAFNTAKTWLNINRREAFKKWFSAVNIYLRQEVNPL